MPPPPPLTAGSLCVPVRLTPAGGCMHAYKVGTCWWVCACECLVNDTLTSCLFEVSLNLKPSIKTNGR